MNTKRISRNCGVFAATTVMTSTFFFTACNSDDDFDFGPNKQYTLADRMMTRAEGSFTRDFESGSASKSVPIGEGFYALISVSWKSGTFPMNFKSVGITPNNNDNGHLTITAPSLNISSASWTSSDKTSIDVTINSNITIKDTVKNTSATAYLAVVTIDDVSLTGIPTTPNSNNSNHENDK